MTHTFLFRFGLRFFFCGGGGGEGGAATPKPRLSLQEGLTNMRDLFPPRTPRDFHGKLHRVSMTTLFQFLEGRLLNLR